MGKETETSPEVSASAEELKESKVVTSVSHSFRVEWKIPTTAFTDRNHVPRPMPKSLSSHKLDEGDYRVIENSKLFEFKSLKIHPFNLVLFKNRFNTCEIKLVTNSPGPQLEYAFICINDRPLYLSIPNKSPPPYMKDEGFHPRKVSSASKEDITIMCGISAISGVNLSPPKDVNSDLEDDDRLVWKSSFIRGLPPFSHTSWSSKTSLTGEEAFFKYFYGGELPALDVGLAKDLLAVCSRKENAELKALCVEYLVENLSVENVAGVMKAAYDNHVKYLVEKCIEFISNYCYMVDATKIVIEEEEFVSRISVKS